MSVPLKFGTSNAINPTASQALQDDIELLTPSTWDDCTLRRSCYQGEVAGFVDRIPVPEI